MKNNLLLKLSSNKVISSQVSGLKQTITTLIDFIIILPIRILAISIYFQPRINIFAQDFRQKFGNINISNNPEHINFLINHQIVYQLLNTIFIFIVIGIIYNILFYLSNWQATIGKRLFHIMVANKNGNKIGFINAFFYYFANNLNIIYVTLILFYSYNRKIGILEAVLSNIWIISLGLFLLASFYYSIFSKNKSSLIDVLCNVYFTKGKTNYKYPF